MGTSKNDFDKTSESAKASNSLAIRDTLFGDSPLQFWAKDIADEPWQSFKQAQTQLEARQNEQAIQSLLKITEMPNLESRHYLQAWHALKQFGINAPDNIARHVYGVVIEVGMREGLDLLAVYEDYHARYYNFSGAGVIWEAPDTSLNSQIDNILQVAGIIVERIGLWEGERPAAPEMHHVRLNFLTASGLHFGYGPLELFSRDPMGGPLLELAVGLMTALIEKTKS